MSTDVTLYGWAEEVVQLTLREDCNPDSEDFCLASDEMCVSSDVLRELFYMKVVELLFELLDWIFDTENFFF